MKYLFSLIFLCLASSSFSQDFEQNGIYFSITSFADLTCEVCKVPDGATQYSGDIFIPETVSHFDRTFTITGIGAYAFSSSTITSITVPDNIESIGTAAFAGCNISTFLFPAHLRYLGDSAFHGSHLKSAILPDGVETMLDACFGSCPYLESITLSKSLKSIPINCFYECTILKELVIPDNVRTISGGALNNCTALETLTIGENVTDISRLYFCTSTPNLKTIICKNSNTPAFFCEWSYIEDRPFSTELYLNTKLVVPTGSLERYKSTSPWNNFQHIEEADLASIEQVETNHFCTPILYYNVNGTSSHIPFNGINIVKYSDGTYKKVIF